MACRPELAAPGEDNFDFNTAPTATGWRMKGLASFAALPPAAILGVHVDGSHDSNDVIVDAVEFARLKVGWGSFSTTASGGSTRICGWLPPAHNAFQDEGGQVRVAWSIISHPEKADNNHLVVSQEEAAALAEGHMGARTSLALTPTFQTKSS